MKPMELAADTAEKNYDKLRKQLKAQRASIKKHSKQLLESSRAIVSEGRQATKSAQKLWLLFEAQMKKKVRDALSLKKENGYELPLGQVDVMIKNVEPELMEEAGSFRLTVRKRVNETSVTVAASSSEESQEQEDGAGSVFAPRDRAGDEQQAEQDNEDDSRRVLALNAINYVVDNRVENWNSRPSAAAQRFVLSRLAVIHLWKKSNTRGGCFQLKKMNHVAGAVLSYEPAKCELRIALTVAEGEPSDDQLSCCRKTQAKGTADLRGQVASRRHDDWLGGGWTSHRGRRGGRQVIGLGCLAVHLGLLQMHVATVLQQMSGVLVGLSLIAIGLLGFKERHPHCGAEAKDYDPTEEEETTAGRGQSAQQREVDYFGRLGFQTGGYI
eukprot:Skav233633  [mRNA]  locus=scaffold2779:59053:66732:- [translate_table: standard]